MQEPKIVTEPMEIIEADALILLADIGGGFLREADSAGEKFALGMDGDGGVGG